jgi:hypothetical protein
MVIGAVRFGDEPIKKGVTPVKASHVVELRNAIDAVRGSAAAIEYAHHSSEHDW